MRYHGGKWRLAPWIIEHLPEHRIYVEPFCGAASVLMRKPRSYSEVINDLEGEVVNVFRVLKDPDQADELERQLRLTPFARQEFDLSWQPAGGALENARRTIMRSFMGFGSASVTRTGTTGFRAAASRSGTTPAHDWSRLPKHLQSWTKRLRGVVIESRDALEIIEQQDTPETAFYIDPPYVSDTRNTRGAYRHDYTDADHRRLAEQLHGVQGGVVLSGYDCDLYRELFGGWRKVQREVNASGQQGGIDRTECLWLNPTAQERQRQHDLFDTMDEPQQQMEVAT